MTSEEKYFDGLVGFYPFSSRTCLEIYYKNFWKEMEKSFSIPE